MTTDIVERLRAEVERHREKAISLGADLMHRDVTIAQLSREASMLRAEVEALREACAEAYQVVGAGMLGEPGRYSQDDVVRALDNLSAAASGEPRPHDDLLPWPRSVDDDCPVMELALCEARKMVLRPGALYRFMPVPDCPSCQALAAEARESYADEDPARPA